jgi:D-lyxose ketol-isomerase
MWPHHSEGTEMAGCIYEFVSNISNILLCKVSHCAVSAEDAQMQPTAAKSVRLGPEMTLHFGSGQYHVFWSDDETNVELVMTGHYVMTGHTV